MRSILLTIWCVLVWVRPFASGLIVPQLGTLLQLALLGLSVACIVGRARPSQSTPPLSWAVAAWLGFGLFAMLTSPERMAAERSWLDLMAGAAVIPVVWRAGEQHQRRLINGLLTGALLISAFALLQAYVVFPRLAQMTADTTAAHALQDLLNRRRVLGPFPHPNLLAGYFAMLIPLAGGVLTAAPARGWRWSLALSSIVLMTVVLLLTKSLGAILALAAACGVVLIGRRTPPRRLWIGGLATAIIVIGALVAARPALRDWNHEDNPFRNRLAYWQVNASIIREHPIRGAGLGQFRARYETMQPTEAPRVVHAHNSYLELWIELGLVGLLVWLWIVWEVLRAGTKRGTAVAIAAWVFVLHNLVGSSLYFPQVTILWWLIAGLSTRRQRNEGDARPPSG